MNQRLQTIGTETKISKQLHVHLARHTFATTVTLSNGVPIESVSSKLGHASLKQTQHYAKIIFLKLQNDMSKINGLYLEFGHVIFTHNTAKGDNKISATFSLCK